MCAIYNGAENVYSCLAMVLFMVNICSYIIQIVNNDTYLNLLYVHFNCNKYIELKGVCLIIECALIDLKKHKNNALIKNTTLVSKYVKLVSTFY